ncbi:conserved exported hypothetical protein [Candidatus Terasakiella magnetica]|uniref:Lipoprotein n=1 Tax=Candidatus Terasakiella magnetica TaxID=1867952 RepID=A0A1C3RHI2_9PROT|nr:hypothetical protein [Candidatus Terasakiella magnetica]SCA56729.1 conserved exported hypothetical protein [Candidatus Terasakiella magnetica]
MKKLSILAVSITAFALAACQTTTQEKPASNVNLAPAERVLMKAGEVRKIKSLRDGSERISTITMVDDKTVKWEVSDGCWGTATTDDRFAPTLSWNKCGTNPEWNTGTSSIIKKEGNIWPLMLGSKVKYTFSATSSRGRVSPNYRECEVTGVVQAEAAGKTYDAFKVSCDEKYRKRTYYYAPSEERVVLEKNYHKRRNTNEVTEFVAEMK